MSTIEQDLPATDAAIDDAPAAESNGRPSRGPITRPGNRLCIGRVGAPAQHEATSNQFYFWVPPDALVERTQIVTCESTIAGQHFEYAALIDEVHHRGRERDMGGVVDGADSDLAWIPPFASDGYTYCSASILRIDPPVLTPPRDRSDVLLAGPGEAGRAYGFDEMARPMAIGRLRNGGSRFAGLAQIDLHYLLGENGGHLNVTGMAGAGAKSSLLMLILKCLLHAARPQLGREPLHVVPIVLNVKGEDLMWINHRNRQFGDSRRSDQEDWHELGIPAEPFVDATFYAPADRSGSPTIDGCPATAYSWALREVIEQGLLRFLFAGDDLSPAMSGLVVDIATDFVDNNGRLRADRPQTWEDLLDWIRGEGRGDLHGHLSGTWRAIYRRLRETLTEAEGLFPRGARAGQPLRVTRDTTTAPQVIDIHALAPALQRFVVAAIVKQVVEARAGRNATRGLRYLLVLDELNRFAPRSSGDDITRLLEQVASEMRSQGVILLGAQQLASLVSNKVIENASIRVAGRTGAAELQDRVWQGWDRAARIQAGILKPDEKLVMQPTFRQPMFVKIPFPAWAMRREDVAAPRLEALPEV